jgi:hypothetical protein
MKEKKIRKITKYMILLTKNLLMYSKACRKNYYANIKENEKYRCLLYITKNKHERKENLVKK